MAVKGNATLIVDLGNSSTKCQVLYGKKTNGQFKKFDFEIPNTFDFVYDADYKVSSDYDTDTSAIISIDTEILGNRLVGDFCNGELQEKEFGSGFMPSALEKKWALTTTPLSLRMAFVRAMEIIQKVSKSSSVDNLDITWNVVSLLPPGDINMTVETKEDGTVVTGADKLKAIIKDICYITSKYPEMSFDVNIDKVNILPEGYCAYAGCIYDNGQIFRDGYKAYTEETILICDIGSGTTDILMIKDNKLVQNSKTTIKAGGSNVTSRVLYDLALKGVEVNDESIELGIIKGFVKNGAQKVSIVEEVNKAKREVANTIVNEISMFFKRMNINTGDIAYVICCGGGALKSAECLEIDSLGEKVVDCLKRYAPHAELMPYPKVKIIKENEFGEPYKVEEELSPRKLNLIGAGILAEIL